ncbi:hypothetical protein B0A55_03074 [Friedmanniomyces simplex]|uniref:Uncharacterized protein n=1 Tax=Friedmanniomyces simplex TaxID=329884 RepID=A0A4U0XLC0_9PEZI|nr:hypothetical protein B0A55_03074 [Friedmanniomyces simplex]
MNGHNGWCNCPDCPQTLQNGQVWGPNYVWMPKYPRNHWHHICDWCELWNTYAPNFQSEPLYLQNIQIMEGIHLFFRGYPFAPYKVAEYIYAVADALRVIDRRGRHSRRLKSLVRDLEDLADQVEGGLFVNARGRGWGQQQGLRWAPAGRMLMGRPGVAGGLKV